MAALQKHSRFAFFADLIRIIFLFARIPSRRDVLIKAIDSQT